MKVLAVVPPSSVYGDCYFSSARRGSPGRLSDHPFASLLI